MLAMPKELNAVMTKRRDIAPGLAVFRVAPDGWDVREFKAGQYVVLGLPGNAGVPNPMRKKRCRLQTNSFCGLGIFILSDTGEHIMCPGLSQ